MIIVAVLVLAILTFIFIVYPLFKQGQHSTKTAENEKLQELYSKRDTTYSMLKEIEFDFQSGILTLEDYKDLESRYKNKAISILKEIDSIEKIKDSEVEEEIEKQVLELRRGKIQFCPQCGARCYKGDKFCSQCGTNLTQKGGS